MKIENNIIIILGQRGAGKTLLSTIFWLDYNIIYSNYTLEYTKNKKKVIKYDRIEDILSLSYREEKRLVILDEWGVNVNSRESMKEFNIALWKFIFLSRKVNCDFVFIAQYDFTIDKYIRYSADYNIIARWRNGNNNLEYDIYKVDWVNEKWSYIKTIELDLDIYNSLWIKYNTLEKSILL